MNSIMRSSKDRNGMQERSFSGLVDKIFHDNISRFFDDEFWTGNGGTRAATVPPLNVRETDNSYEMELVAPGINKEELKIHVNNDVLTVSFDHKEEQSQENKNDGWLRKEYRRQSFSRSFNLDDTIDANNITARYNDGVLHLSLPKKEGAQELKRTIEIQ